MMKGLLHTLQQHVVYSQGTCHDRLGNVMAAIYNLNIRAGGLEWTKHRVTPSFSKKQLPKAEPQLLDLHALLL